MPASGSLFWRLNLRQIVLVQVQQVHPSVITGRTSCFCAPHTVIRTYFQTTTITAPMPLRLQHIACKARDNPVRLKAIVLEQDD